MSASAAGTIENPGKKVKQKSSLNRSILDQGWYAFSRMLSYKLERRGGRLIKVDPRNTSRTCPQCGLVSAENRKTQASFACVACGYRANADLVGAINVLRAGRARLACGMSGAVRNPKRPAAALGYGRCRGGIESSPFMMRRTSTLGTSEFIALRMAEEIYVENGESACFSTMVSAELSLITSKRFCALLV